MYKITAMFEIFETVFAFVNKTLTHWKDGETVDKSPPELKSFAFEVLSMSCRFVTLDYAAFIPERLVR